MRLVICLVDSAPQFEKAAKLPLSSGETLEFVRKHSGLQSTPAPQKAGNRMSKWACRRCVIGGDHAGYSMKVLVEKFLRDAGIDFIDCGAHSEQPSDFPDFAESVAKEILSGKADRGILVCGSGVGVSVAANKIPGIRASLCHDTYSAHQGVEHDDMNVLCIGARVIVPNWRLKSCDRF